MSILTDVRNSFSEHGGGSIPHAGELRRYGKRLKMDGWRKAWSQMSNLCLTGKHGKCLGKCPCLCHDPRL